MFECEFYMLGSILFIYMVGNYKFNIQNRFQKNCCKSIETIVVNKINWFMATYYLCVFAGHKIIGSLLYKEGAANFFLPF